MKKHDLILIAAFLIIAGLAFVYIKIAAKYGSQVVITVDKKTVASVSLYDNQEINIPLTSGKNIVVIKDGSVTMKEADCPDQICVEHKPISKTGETIVCLPHKVVVEVVNAEESEIDMMAQ